MTSFALGLVLVSAVTHATWNLLAKRSGADTAFLFVVYVVGAVAYAPFAIAIVVIAMPALGPLALGFVAVSVLLQTVYFATLTAGYRAGDLSLVYPLARATGPLLATAGAIAIFGERPTPTALAGALAIAVGALVLVAQPELREPRARDRALLPFLLLDLVAPDVDEGRGEELEHFVEHLLEEREDLLVRAEHAVAHAPRRRDL